MPGRPKAIADTIGLGKVDLVGCSSVERVMGHLSIVLPNVDIDQLLELPEALE